MIKRAVVFILFISLYSVTSRATNISGQIKINDSWEPLIYLSVINSFHDLNTASYDFLLARTTIDAKGFFEFSNFEIPQDERIYRLHICKKNDPVSTIIIGGRDENFIHFIMKDSDSLFIQPNPELSGFNHSIILGHPANNCLIELFTLRKNLNSPPELPSAQSRQLLRNQILEDYTIIADTSSYSIIQLLAMYFVNESFSLSSQIKRMERIHDKVQESDTSSPYYQAFLGELSYVRYQAKTNTKTKAIWITITVIAIVLIMLFIRYFRKNTPQTLENDFSKLATQLSVQEKRVLDLLKDGKSNKEISQELHIEVSTVKSHLNKIYSRLGVKSRKEIVNSDW